MRRFILVVVLVNTGITIQRKGIGGIDEEVIRRILERPHLEGMFLRAAGDLDLLDLPLLLRSDRRQREGSGLYLCLNAEERLAAPDQGRPLQRYVARLHALHDLVVVPGVLDLELVFVFEGAARVPVGHDVQLVADRAVDVHLHFLAEVGFVAALIDAGESRLVGFDIAEPGLDIDCAADGQINLVFPEDAEERIRRDGDTDLRDVAEQFAEVVLLEECLRPAGLIREDLVQFVPLPGIHVLLQRHRHRRFHIDPVDGLRERDVLPRGIDNDAAAVHIRAASGAERIGTALEHRNGIIVVPFKIEIAKPCARVGAYHVGRVADDELSASEGVEPGGISSSSKRVGVRSRDNSSRHTQRVGRRAQAAAGGGGIGRRKEWRCFIAGSKGIRVARAGNETRHREGSGDPAEHGCRRRGVQETENVQRCALEVHGAHVDSHSFSPVCGIEDPQNRTEGRLPKTCRRLQSAPENLHREQTGTLGSAPSQIHRSPISIELDR